MSSIMNSLFSRQTLSSTSNDPTPKSVKDHLVFLILLLLGFLSAFALYSRFIPLSDNLWYSLLHDRNAHISLAMNFAIDFRTMDIAHFFRDLHSVRIWGPLHPLLAGIIMAIGGLDERLAVLPSLFAWMMTGVFAFLIVRRLAATNGNLAGLAAATLVWSSPAYRAFATDVMLESLGACLSLGAVYFWIRMEQDGKRADALGLALMLSLIFFHKYNYWIMVILPMILLSLAKNPFEKISDLLFFLEDLGSKAWLEKQVFHPVNWVIGALAGLLALLAITGGMVHIGSIHMEIKSLQNLYTVLAVVMAIRVLPWWYLQGRYLVSRASFPVREMVYWHIWPIVLWFFWPQKLGNCIAYLTRHHGDGEAVPEGILGGFPYYWSCMVDHYHAASWLPWIVVFLCAIAFHAWFMGKFKKGSDIVFLFMMVALLMTFRHPTLRSRFLHSWVDILWVVGCLGLSRLSPAVIFGNGLGRWGQAGWNVVLMAAIFAVLPAFSQLGRSPEGGPKGDRVSYLELFRSYQPMVMKGKDVLVVSHLPLKFLSSWTFLQKSGHHGNLLTDIPGMGPNQERNLQVFNQWIKNSGCETVVYIDIPRNSTFYEPVELQEYQELGGWLKECNQFHAYGRQYFPEFGNPSVTVWKREDPSGIMAELGE